MSLTPAEKEVIIREFGLHEGDTGSPQVQIAVLTERIRQLTGQVEELTFTVNQLQQQLGQKQGNAGAVMPPAGQMPVQKKIATAPPPQPAKEVITRASTRNNAKNFFISVLPPFFRVYIDFNGKF